MKEKEMIGKKYFYRTMVKDIINRKLNDTKVLSKRFFKAKINLL